MIDFKNFEKLCDENNQVVKHENLGATFDKISNCSLGLITLGVAGFGAGNCFENKLTSKLGLIAMAIGAVGTYSFDRLAKKQYNKASNISANILSSETEENDKEMGE